MFEFGNSPDMVIGLRHSWENNVERGWLTGWLTTPPDVENVGPVKVDSTWVA